MDSSFPSLFINPSTKVFHFTRRLLVSPLLYSTVETSSNSWRVHFIQTQVIDSHSTALGYFLQHIYLWVNLICYSLKRREDNAYRWYALKLNARFPNSALKIKSPVKTHRQLTPVNRKCCQCRHTKIPIKCYLSSVSCSFCFFFFSFSLSIASSSVIESYSRSFQ